MSTRPALPWPHIPVLPWPYYWELQFTDTRVSVCLKKRPWFCPLRCAIEDQGSDYLFFDTRDVGNAWREFSLTPEQVVAELSEKMNKIHDQWADQRGREMAKAVRAALPKGTKVKVKRA